MPIGTDDYRGNKEEWLALVNLYADLGTWWCITPFIGVGVGGVKTTTQASSTPTLSPTALPSRGDELKFNFAYALHAGLGYRVSNSLTMELAYRDVHLGDAQSGDLRTFNGINNVTHPMHFNGITSHDVKLGVRWTCCEPAAPVAPGADAPRLSATKILRTQTARIDQVRAVFFIAPERATTID